MCSQLAIITRLLAILNITSIHHQLGAGLITIVTMWTLCADQSPVMAALGSLSLMSSDAAKRLYLDINH